MAMFLLRLFAATLMLGPVLTASAQQPGTLDVSFEVGAGLGGKGLAEQLDVAWQSDGKAVVVGPIAPWPGLVRLNRDGTVDRTFNLGQGFSFADFKGPWAVAVQPNDKIIVAGDFRVYEGAGRNSILRLNADGSLDASYDAGAALRSTAGYLYIRDLFALADGKIVALGVFDYTVGGATRSNLARFHADGSLDESFVPDSAAVSVETMAVSPGGMVVLNVIEQGADGDYRSRLLRLLPSGAIDPDFSSATITRAALDPFTGELVDGIGNVDSLEILPDGSVLVAGVFGKYNGVNKPNFVKITPSGALDSSFETDGFRELFVQSNGQTVDRPGRVLTLTAAGGKIYAGGTFTNFGSLGRPLTVGYARLHADGSLDTSFSGSGVSIPFSGRPYPSEILMRPDSGELLLVGGFQQINGVRANNVAQLFPTGAVDAAFVANTRQGLDAIPTGITLQPDGKLLVSGEFQNVNGGESSGLVRLLENGMVDPGFDLGTGFVRLSGGVKFPGVVDAVAVQEDGHIIVAASHTREFNGTVRNGLLRLRPDGSLDPTFDVGEGFYYVSVRGRVFDMALWRDPADSTAAQKIVVTGGFTHFVGETVSAREGIARLNADGSLDPTFNVGTGFTTTGLSHVPMTSVAVQPDGKILAAGDANRYNGTPISNLARLNPDGSLDTAFNASAAIGTSTSVTGFKLRPDGKILVIGTFYSEEEGSAAKVVRLNADGSLDPGFNAGTGFTGPSGLILNDIALQADGKVVVGGNFSSYRGTSRNGVARLNVDGTLDPNFNPGSGVTGDVDVASVLGLALQSDGKLVLGGEFNRYNGTVRHYLARLHGEDVSSLPGTFQFAPADYRVHEGTTLVRLLVSRTSGTLGAAGVSYTTGNGTALAGSDFTAASGTLSWAAGEGGSKIIEIEANHDLLAEGSESFTVTLSNPSGAALGAASATVTFLDPPFDNWRFFHFGAEANHAAVGAALADPDADALSNLLEYALGHDPLEFSPEGLPVLSFADRQLSLTFTRSPEAFGLRYTVQISSDLLAWLDGSSYSDSFNVIGNPATSDVTPPGSPEGYTIVNANNPTGSPRLFMRLKVENR